MQSDPNTQHVAASLAAMECIVVQDLFLNETAKYAHVLLPGSSFLVGDAALHSTPPHSRVRKVMEPKNGKAGFEVTGAVERAGLPHEPPPARDHGRDRAPDADLQRRQP